MRYWHVTLTPGLDGVADLVTHGRHDARGAGAVDAPAQREEVAPRPTATQIIPQPTRRAQAMQSTMQTFFYFQSHVNTEANVVLTKNKLWHRECKQNSITSFPVNILLWLIIVFERSDFTALERDFKHLSKVRHIGNKSQARNFNRTLNYLRDNRVFAFKTKNQSINQWAINHVSKYSGMQSIKSNLFAIIN